ncbi:sulfotransferase family protein [Argonema antarcticum]|uniref:sulfotransferase family protein n=1 Tax=Argonema antarcticum TaxID=2942763 RepID=UPI002012FA74|nr:sulfotransferase [Argonema antarcticum]MCL1469347.1 sulfotransferase [Argonema antarcticum A004/B2]
MQINKLKQLIPQPIKRLKYNGQKQLKKLQTEWETISAKVNPKPIIVLGNQKSGTSAIAALLGEMTGQAFLIDMMKSNDRNIYEPVKKGEISFRDFIKLNKLEFSKNIIKEPNLTLFYDELVEHFPEAKFAFVIRDPRNNIRSMLDLFEIPGNLNQMEQEHYNRLVRSWPSIFDGTWLGIKGENYIEILAERWNYTANVYLQNRDQILLVKYEDFVKDKIGEIARLAEKLGLQPVKDISDKVDVQFQPAGGNKNVKWKQFFGEDNLARIEGICGEKMKQFNYLQSHEMSN